MTQHRPTKETKTPASAPTDRLFSAISQGKAGAFERALNELTSSHPAINGLWQHRALRLTFDVEDRQTQMHFLKTLLECKTPPKPTPTENLMGAALIKGQVDLLPLLNKAGFSLKPKYVDGTSPITAMTRLLAEGVWAYPEFTSTSILTNKTHREKLSWNLAAAALCPRHYIDGRGFFRINHIQKLIGYIQASMPDKQDQQQLGREIGGAIGKSIHQNVYHQGMEQQNNWQEGFFLMVNEGLLDLECVRLTAEKNPDKTIFLRLIEAGFSKALNDQMERQTPEATRETKRHTIRL